MIISSHTSFSFLSLTFLHLQQLATVLNGKLDDVWSFAQIFIIRRKFFDESASVVGVGELKECESCTAFTLVVEHEFALN